MSGVHVIPTRDSKGHITQLAEPFKSKATANGSLYRRKHGFIFAAPILAGESATLDLVVPYNMVKINELEFVDCNKGDAIDMVVHDTPTGTLSTFPNAPLNQFGFNAYLSDAPYKDVSEYDADLIKDMVIKITYKNNSAEAITPKGNITWHEIKP